MIIADMASDSRPRERLERMGAQGLSHAELLALILCTGTRDHNVIELSELLLSKHGLGGLSRLRTADLAREMGIGTAKASKLLAAFELARRLPMAQQEKPRVHRADDVFSLYRERFLGFEQEVFMVVFLDVRNAVIGDEVVTVGTLTSSVVHPREVFTRAISRGAHSIIIIHNHPSGDPSPSTEDEEVTSVLESAGEIVGIPVMDHIILGRGKYYSFKENPEKELSPH